MLPPKTGAMAGETVRATQEPRAVCHQMNVGGMELAVDQLRAVDRQLRTGGKDCLSLTCLYQAKHHPNNEQTESDESESFQEGSLVHRADQCRATAALPWYHVRC
jgi:hypothetical protein